VTNASNDLTEKTTLTVSIEIHKGAIFDRLKIIVICVSRPKNASFFDDKRHFWQRSTLNFLAGRTNYKAKEIMGKITNLFCIYVFQIDKIINTY
jgi:hypothetical protein